MTTPQQSLFLDPTATAGSPASQGVLRDRFPPRTVPLSWPATEADRDPVLDRLTSPPFVPKHPVTAYDRRRGLRQVLDWLGNQAGSTWQERWRNSGAEQAGGKLWRHLTEGAPNTHISTGLLILICADAIRPSTAWMLGRKLTYLQKVMSQVRDPDGLALLQGQAETDGIPGQVARMAGTRAAIILACKGGSVRDITVGDCVELLDTQDTVQSEGGGKLVLYQLLHRAGHFPPDAPSTIRAFRAALGQRSPEELVDQYQITCRPVRDLLVDYLRERQPSVDYATLRQLGRILGGLFWRDLEAHHPGIETLRLPPTVAAAWKQRLQTKESTSTDTAGQTVTRVSVRESARSVLITVRAFYLDLAQWAAEDPARWAPWAVSSPITAAETNRRKERGRQKSRADQRTRERLPVLPVLVKVTDQRRQEAATLLEDCRTVLPGTLFTAAGRTLLRPLTRGSAGIKVWAEEVAAGPDSPSGPRRDLSWEEYDAFWAWAAIEVLRHTGIRIEELGELSHHSFIQYTLPSTGEVVPLLQIAPSKTDQERLLLISPELADVLSRIVLRIRDQHGAVPLVAAYDPREKVWNPQMPLLFQHRVGVEHRPIPASGIRKMLDRALAATGLTDAVGDPLQFQPHDFRRIFITDAIMNGLPPHIAQIVAGHSNINATMGYKAVYPMEAIEAHRAFIIRRRATRPGEEYRTPTNEEWDAFLGHFENRKLSIGTCGRAFGTPCIHEHACVRCSLLRPDPAQRPRLVEIRDNLIARIAEAEREGWLGEIDGLRVSLAGAEDKLAQIDRRSPQSVNLGMPGRVASSARVAMADKEGT